MHWKCSFYWLFQNGVRKVINALTQDTVSSYIFAWKYLTTSNKTVPVTYSEVFPYKLATFCPWAHIVLFINVLCGRAKWSMIYSEWFFLHRLLHRRHGLESPQMSHIMGKCVYFWAELQMDDGNVVAIYSTKVWKEL